jgi:uncharacterized GH25 family protein
MATLVAFFVQERRGVMKKGVFFVLVLALALMTAGPASAHFGMVIPSDYMVTQTIKADGNGVFTYGAPRAGWWGFAALNTSDTKMKQAGEDKDVELGAVLWVEFLDMK